MTKCGGATAEAKACHYICMCESIEQQHLHQPVSKGCASVVKVCAVACEQDAGQPQYLGLMQLHSFSFVAFLYRLPIVATDPLVANWSSLKSPMLRHVQCCSIQVACISIHHVFAGIITLRTRACTEAPQLSRCCGACSKAMLKNLETRTDTAIRGPANETFP